MSTDDELTRRQFLQRCGLLGLAIPVVGCGGEKSLNLEDPCSVETTAGEGTQLICSDGLQGVVSGRELIVEGPDGEKRYDELLRFGYGTDLHYADHSTVHDEYRSGDVKLGEAVEIWNRADIEFAVMGGDYIDSDHDSDRDDVMADIRDIEAVFDNLDVPRHYVMGNHDLDSIAKSEFVEHTAMEELYYSFDRGGFHFVVLDANFSSFDDDAGYREGEFSHLDIWINPSQLQWLQEDLEAASKPTVVLTHQRLAREGGDFAENSGDVRALFADADVVAVLSSHAHENENTVVDGIHYFCMDAMVTGGIDDNAVAVIHLYENHHIFIEGFGNQKSYLRRL